MHSSIPLNQPLDFLWPSLTQPNLNSYKHPDSTSTSRRASRPTNNSELPSLPPPQLLSNTATATSASASSIAPSSFVKSGLRTPPLDMMASGAPPEALFPPSYGRHYSNGPSHTHDHAHSHGKIMPSSNNPHSASSNVGNSYENQFNTSSGPFRQPSVSQSRTGSSAGLDGSHRKRSSDNAIVPSLQIPSSINDSKGSLAEFAAQITCLFWFESSFVLHRVEKSNTLPMPSGPLVPEAIPTTGFRKWVTTILSTTQVTQNVILLALLFIYRLKKLNPTVKGKTGSEFRLLTVALMLGNKFLDDNTYTNKTWAEVSGISVQEIHIMEVEFLSNMRYGLFTSEEEWTAWTVKLGRFWQYFDQASRMPAELSPRSLGQSNPPSALPSPPASTHASPPFVPSHSPSHPSYPHPMLMPPHLAPLPSAPSPIPPMPELDLRPSGRKRSYDETGQEPPQKRMTRQSQPPSLPYLLSNRPPSGQSTNISSSTYSSSTIQPTLPRLPVPNLTLSTAQSNGGYQNPSVGQLPPPSGKAMSMVFPPPTAAWPLNSHTATPGSTASGPAPHNLSLSPFNHEQSHRGSPFPPVSSNSSPTTAMFPHQTPAANSLSPSYFLTHRNSPYGPVRSVHTLLVPPPSGTSQRAPQTLGFDQMHYQPLGKSKDQRRAGVVPYFQPEAWQNLPNLQYPQYSG